MAPKSKKKPDKPEEALTTKQRRFVEAYDGNATEAARVAGYGGDDNVLGVTGFHLLRNPKVRAAIHAREDFHLGDLVATREERQALWTSVLRDTAQDMAHRLRAAELLGKSEADFTDKVEHGLTKTLEQLLTEATKPEET